MNYRDLSHIKVLMRHQDTPEARRGLLAFAGCWFSGSTELEKARAAFRRAAGEAQDASSKEILRNS